MSTTSLDKSKIKIVLLEGIHDTAVETFERAGYSQIVRYAKAPETEQLRAEIADCHMLGIRSRTNVTAKELSAANKLIAVGCFCIGTNQVDLNQALAQGIPVFNAPYSNTRSVAELVLGEAILLQRRVPEKNAATHLGHWSKTADGSNEIRGKTLGIIGYGNIGTQLGVLAEALGMRVIFHDIVTKLPLGNARQVSLLDLLRTADVISLHVPENDSTSNLIGATELAQLKPNCVLINTSRGKVVDLRALEAALDHGKLKGAAIDVFPQEPRGEDEPFENALRRFDNVLLTPHIGGSTVEAQENIGREVAEKLVQYSDKGSTVSAVNFPEVALPEHPGQHRLLHIHHNRPGVLSEINRVFSSNTINILGQYLQTNATVGYVVVDIDREYSELALKKLRQVDGTIRCRILW
jgi:D-3-phosphoglycerate dehydrogenase